MSFSSNKMVLKLPSLNFRLFCVSLNVLEYIPIITQMVLTLPCFVEYGLNQWETTLHCNVVSHCLSPHPESSPGLISVDFTNIIQDYFTGVGAYEKKLKTIWE